MARYLIIEDGVVVNTVEADADFAASQGWIQDEQAGIGWTYDGTTFSPPAPSSVEPVPKSPFLYAAGTITFEDGEVTSITGNWNWKLSACLRADTGVYFVFFTDPLPDDDYMAKAWDGGKSCFISKDEQFPDYFIITVKDLAGDPSDASTISVEVIRAN